MVVRRGVCHYCGSTLVGCAGHYSCAQCVHAYGQFGIDQASLLSGRFWDKLTPWFGTELETLEQEENERQRERARWRRDLFRGTCERRKESLQLSHDTQLVEVGRAVLAEMGLSQGPDTQGDEQ